LPGVKPGLDLALAAKLSGARFMVLRGAVARVHRALAQFMIDTTPPNTGCGMLDARSGARRGDVWHRQAAEIREDSYQTTNGWWLIPTSEVTLTNLAGGEILDGAALPVRMTAHTHCFRSEAGLGGQGHHGHPAPAPVREGRDGDDLPPEEMRWPNTTA
jgi:seryl-tRNA synthetase